MFWKFFLLTPDAFIIDIETDEKTGRKVARIIGVVDAKLGEGISKGQRKGIKYSLTELITALKPHYGELVQSLDIANELPEEIDINPQDKLSVKMIRPKDIRDKLIRSGNIKFATSIFVPVTRQDVSNIYMAMVRDVLAGH